MGPAKTRIAGCLTLPVAEASGDEEIVGWLEASGGSKVSTNVGISMAQGMLGVRVQGCDWWFCAEISFVMSRRHKCEKTGIYRVSGNQTMSSGICLDQFTSHYDFIHRGQLMYGRSTTRFFDFFMRERYIGPGSESASQWI
jgi:hypothetical protein